MARTVPLVQINRELWHRSANDPMLGCSGCSDLAKCGGLRVQAPAWSCRDFCCRRPGNCNAVCPSDPATFVARRREVGGWDLTSLPRIRPTHDPDVPPRVPMIYHGKRRSDILELDYVSVPLRALMNTRESRSKVENIADVARLLRVQPRRGLLIDCIGVDSTLERYWGKARAQGIVAAFSLLAPTWILTPNFSVWNDVPRWDNFHNMKRIAICWHELTAAGIPTALHVNARTDHDWDRWIEFVGAREEVQGVSFEFATGGRYLERREWQVAQLARLGAACSGRLRLFIRGGAREVDHLARHFRSITLIETKQFMKAVKRQRLSSDGSGRVTSTRSWTLVGQPLDELLAGNIGPSRLESDPLILTRHNHA